MDFTQHKPRLRAAWLTSILLASTATCTLHAASQDSSSSLLTRGTSTASGLQAKNARDPVPASGVVTQSTPPATPPVSATATEPAPSTSAAKSTIVRPVTALDRAARVQLLTFSRAYNLSKEPRLSQSSPTWKLWINDYTVLRRSSIKQLGPQALSILTLASASDIRLTEEMISSKLLAQRVMMFEAGLAQLERRSASKNSKAGSAPSSPYSDLLCFWVDLPGSQWNTFEMRQQVASIHHFSYSTFARWHCAAIFAVKRDEEQLADMTQLQQSILPDASDTFTTQTGGTPPPSRGQATPAR